MSGVTLQLPDELIEQIEARIEARLFERLSATKETDAGWLRSTKAIAAYIGAPPSRVSALISAGRIWPVKKDGSANVARKRDLDRWIEEGGGVRP